MTHRHADSETYGRPINRVSRGFTLVEVLVALAIVAIALMAGMQATLALTRNAERQSDVLLAHLCAENEMVRIRLSHQMPGVGDTRMACEQGGQTLMLAVSVRPTPNPNFRRIDAEVFKPGGDGAGMLPGGAPGEVAVLKLSTVVGQY